MMLIEGRDESEARNRFCYLQQTKLPQLPPRFLHPSRAIRSNAKVNRTIAVDLIVIKKNRLIR